ncbi:Bud-site selection protein [Cladorrhinum samala]|uniref:Bud-site selection protein n=1 Tax=Cladorrhinum samala TaxID=585594 RepID=A0AAV9H9W6_9PEZI|nr:Bud-site selection protein [Cladorrhinum samala]
MPKRKRSAEESVQSIFTRLRLDVFHALKHAKGFERQRQSKRLRDPKVTPDKKARIEKEIVVLKSLDLQQTAHAHLCSSLLRIKGIAESDKVPEEIKEGVAKPELTEEEKAALHNVTSALYNQEGVKKVIDEAIAAVCGAIGIPVPEKKTKSVKKKPEEQKEEQKEEPKQVEEDTKKIEDKGSREKSAESSKEKAKKKDEEEVREKKPKDPPKLEDELDSEELEKGVDELEAMLGSDSESDDEDEDDDERASKMPEDDIDEDELEEAVSKMEGLLGSDSEDEEEEDEELEKKLAEARVKAKTPLPKDLDPMEITSDEEAGDEADDEDEDGGLDPMEITDEEPLESEEADSSDSEEDGAEASSEEFEGFSDANPASAGDDSSSEEEDEDESGSSSSGSRSPPRKRAKPVKVKMDGNSLFLPTLMGGYISGSESASDVDLAPARKNRRGQRARQQIWEKKYKEKAKHLAKQSTRDAGWDLKRGAVDGDSKPWKKGIKNPLLKKSVSGANEIKVVPKETKTEKRARDDVGSLHPSWEARRLAKEKERLTAPFEGKKITFD